MGFMGQMTQPTVSKHWRKKGRKRLLLLLLCCSDLYFVGAIRCYFIVLKWMCFYGKRYCSVMWLAYLTNYILIILVTVTNVQGLISAGTHGNSVPLLFWHEMNGSTGTLSSQQFPQDSRSLIKIYVTYTRQNTQSNYYWQHCAQRKPAGI